MEPNQYVADLPYMQEALSMWDFKHDDYDLPQERSRDILNSTRIALEALNSRKDLSSEKKAMRMEEMKRFARSFANELSQTRLKESDHQRIVGILEGRLLVIQSKILSYPGDFNLLPPLTEIHDMAEIAPSLKMKWRGMSKRQRAIYVHDCCIKLGRIIKDLTPRTLQDLYSDLSKWKSAYDAEKGENTELRLTPYQKYCPSIPPCIQVIVCTTNNRHWISIDGNCYLIEDIPALRRVINKFYQVLKGNEVERHVFALAYLPPMSLNYWETSIDTWKEDETAISYAQKYQMVIKALSAILATNCKVPLSCTRDSKPIILELFGGDGELAEKVLESFPQCEYFLSDANQDAINDAKKKLQKFNNRAVLSQANALSADFPSLLRGCKPDIVIICGGLTHYVLGCLEEAETILKKLYACMPERGILILNGHQPLWPSKSILEEYFVCHNSFDLMQDQLYILQKREQAQQRLKIRPNRPVNFFFLMNSSKPGPERTENLKFDLKSVPEDAALALGNTDATAEELELIFEHCKKTPSVSLRGVSLSPKHVEALKTLSSCALDLSETNVSQDDIINILGKIKPRLTSLRINNCPQIAPLNQAWLQTVVEVNARPLKPDLSFLGETAYKHPEIVDRIMEQLKSYLRQNPKAVLTFESFLPSEKKLIELLKEFGFERMILNAMTVEKVRGLCPKSFYTSYLDVCAATFGRLNHNDDQEKLITFKPKFNPQDIIETFELIKHVTSEEERRKVNRIVMESVDAPLETFELIKNLFPNIEHLDLRKSDFGIDPYSNPDLSALADLPLKTLHIGKTDFDMNFDWIANIVTKETRLGQTLEKLMVRELPPDDLYPDLDPILVRVSGYF